MPKISASTVKEHRENMHAQLIDAAESILRQSDTAVLTAGAVAKKVGIARNSIYRYVTSVDDLRDEVVERYMRQWKEKVAQRVDSLAAPEQQLKEFAQASLELAAETGHSWLMQVIRARKMAAAPTISTPAATAELPTSRPATSNSDSEYLPGNFHSPRMQYFHHGVVAYVHRLWQQIDAERADINTRLTAALLEAGMKALDEGDPYSQVEAAVQKSLAGLLK